MIIGVPKEIKNNEYRVGLVPSSVREIIQQGHDVLIETKAGLGAGISDEEYHDVGAKLVAQPREIFENADMIVKVKEPQASEYKMLRQGQILFAFLHLAADLAQTKGLIESKCIAIAYETVTSPNGSLPLLMPMSGWQDACLSGGPHLERKGGLCAV